MNAPHITVNMLQLTKYVANVVEKYDTDGEPFIGILDDDDEQRLITLLRATIDHDFFNSGRSAFQTAGTKAASLQEITIEALYEDDGVGNGFITNAEFAPFSDSAVIYKTRSYPMNSIKVHTDMGAKNTLVDQVAYMILTIVSQLNRIIAQDYTFFDAVIKDTAS